MKKIKGLKEARAFVQNKSKSSCTSVGFLLDNGEYLDDNNPQCHIGLKLYGHEDKKHSVEYIISGFQRDHTRVKNFLVSEEESKKGLLKAMFRMLKEHKGWGMGILNETPEDVYENGWVFRTDVPRNLLCSSVFATRWPTEFPANCMAMKMLMDAGCDSDIAFVASLTLSGNEKGGLLEASHPSGHMPCPDGADKGWAKNFLTNKVVNDGEKTYKELPRYSAIDGVYKPGTGYGGGDCSLIYDVLRRSLKKAAKYKPGSDIFYTEALFNKEQAARMGKVSISKEDFPLFIENLHKLKKELMQ